MGVDQRVRELPRRGDGLLDGGARNLVKDYAVDRLVPQGALFLQHFAHVPGNGFAFAIRVRRQIERVGAPQGLGDGLDVALVFIDELILHGEVVLRVHCPTLGHQVAHVPIGGEDLEVLAQVTLDRPRLGGRLDDDQVLAHR